MTEKTDAERFKGLFLISSVIGALIVVLTGLGMGKAMIIAEVQETHTKDIARLQLSDACWARAYLYPPQEQLNRYIYCNLAQVSKAQVSK